MPSGSADGEGRSLSDPSPVILWMPSGHPLAVIRLLDLPEGFVYDKTQKLFIETNKNNCVICGFKSLFYLDLIQHLDIHFYCNYLKKEGKNLFRKKANNKNNWIYGDGGKNTKNKNLEIDTEERKKNGITLINLIFYRNMMNNNLINISNEQEEDDEEFMYPINDENRKVCHYCGDEFKKVVGHTDFDLLGAGNEKEVMRFEENML